MIIYAIVMICLLLNFINPKILWYIDSWKYDGNKPEPSPAYLLINRIVAIIALVIMAGVLYNLKMR